MRGRRRGGARREGEGATEGRAQVDSTSVSAAFGPGQHAQVLAMLVGCARSMWETESAKRDEMSKYQNDQLRAQP